MNVRLLTLPSRGRLVVKQTSDPFGEAMAAALGQLPHAGVRVVPVDRVFRRAIILPFIEGPTLQRAGAFTDARALGHFWAFDLFIDNGDRLLKGANATNFIVGPDGVLYGIDQNIGPAPRESAARARTVTRRRIEPLLRSASRRELSRALFADLRREARGADLGDETGFCTRFELGLLANLQSLGRLCQHQIAAALHPWQQRPGCPWELRDLPGLPAIIEELAASTSNILP